MDASDADDEGSSGEAEEPLVTFLRRVLTVRSPPLTLPMRLSAVRRLLLAFRMSIPAVRSPGPLLSPSFPMGGGVLAVRSRVIVVLNNLFPVRKHHL